MRKIDWSQPARNDLRRIADWLRTEASSEIALSYLRAIRARCAVLENFPRLGPQIDKDVRKLLVSGTSYIILYRLIGTDIEIARVFHSRENWQQN